MGGVSGQTEMPGAGEEELLSPGLLQMVSGPANPPLQESRAFELAPASLPALLTGAQGRPVPHRSGCASCPSSFHSLWTLPSKVLRTFT